LAIVAVWRRELWMARARAIAFAFAALGSVVAVALAWGRWTLVVGAMSLVPLAMVVLLRRPGLPSRVLAALADTVLSHPARLLAVTFGLLSLLGALLLKLPLAAAPGKFITGIDAAFTAMSAVCVTGLIVLDTPNDFSFAGQLILLLLIQLGGLGIMSFSTAAFALLGRRLSLRHESAVADLLAHHRGEMFGAVQRMLIVTVSAELAGALIMWGLFVSAGDTTAMAFWRALFTSVSAFCNAGFALQSDSLIPYQQLPATLHVVATLVIIGGLSPPVVAELPRIARGRALSVHAKMVLIVSAALLIGGALLIGALEWSNTLRPLDHIDRVHGAWFQSVITRTAGFNSVDIAALRPATIWIMTALMFVGGSPGSTAGGIKTTTLAVLFIAVRSAMRGRWEAEALGRSIRTATVFKAAALTTIAVAAVFVGVVAIEVTQPLPLDLALFEVVSALGTVGLSMGATALLDDVGKVVIMSCMFLGRIGPLTLFLFLRERHIDTPWRMPQTEVDVG
jgi:trk system potassium uptake protein TrkH